MTAPRLRAAALLPLALWPARAAAQAPPRYALEVSLSPAAELAFTRADRPAEESGARIFGGALWLALALRTPHFLEPFVEGGLFHLRTSDVRSLDDAALTYRASITARSLLFGASVVPWRWLHVRAAIGFVDVDVTASGGGRAIHPNNLDLAWSFELVGWIRRWPRARVGATARAMLLPESAFAVAAVGLTVAVDPLVW